jgi:hypothetical protein
MANFTLKIPGGGSIPAMSSSDSLEIEVTQACTWSYSDPSNSFSKGFLPNGSYQPNTKWGPYSPTGPGVVSYTSAPAPAPGTFSNLARTASAPHSITVS